MKKFFVNYSLLESEWLSAKSIHGAKNGAVEIDSIHWAAPVFKRNGVVLLGPSIGQPKIGRAPITVLTIVEEAAHHKLSPPIWVEIHGRESLDEFIPDKDEQVYARVWGLVKLLDEANPRPFSVKYGRWGGWAATQTVEL